MNSLVLTYTPGVCVFPVPSGFTPGWVYVHVGGGAMCLISPKLSTCIVGILLSCTALVDLTVRTLCHCVGNVICYLWVPLLIH